MEPTQGRPRSVSRRARSPRLRRLAAGPHVLPAQHRADPEQKCAGNTSGCHPTNADDPYSVRGRQLRRHDFENVQKRRDLLAPFGAYHVAAAADQGRRAVDAEPQRPNKLQVQYGEQFLPLDVLHAGGAILDVNSDAYFTLQNWLRERRDRERPQAADAAADGQRCVLDRGARRASTRRRTRRTRTLDVQDKRPADPDEHSCNAGNCHGAPQSDFYITCGSDDTQIAFNFSQAWSFVNTPVDDSQILRVPLAVAAGGRGHTGGDQFSEQRRRRLQDDPRLGRAGRRARLRDGRSGQAVLRRQRPADPARSAAARSRPATARRRPTTSSCARARRASSRRSRSRRTTSCSRTSSWRSSSPTRGAAARSPRASSPTTSASTGVGGIAHRGGSVLETPGNGARGSGAVPARATPATATPFCTIQEWVTRERAALGTQVTPMNAATPSSSSTSIGRRGSGADRLEFDTFQGGADLLPSPATFGADYGQQPASPARRPRCSATASCAGATGASTSGRPTSRTTATPSRSRRARAPATPLEHLDRRTVDRPTARRSSRRRRTASDPQLRSGVVARRRVHRVRVDARQVRPVRSRASGSCRSPTCGAIKIADGDARADDVPVELRALAAVHARGPRHDDDREGRATASTSSPAAA